MKRPLVVLALPALLAVVWWSGRAGTSTPTAEVRLDVPRVAAARTEVLDRMAAVGGTRTDERTDFGEGDGADLTFRVPSARLDDALASVREVEGATGQQIDVAELASGADSIADELAGLDTCLASLEQEVGRGDVSNRVRQCREQLGRADDRLARVDTPAEDVVVRVLINRTSTTNPALVAGVALLAVALGTLVVMTLRSRPGPDVVDLTEPEIDATFAELYHRRN